MLVIGLIRTGVYCRANCILVTSGLSRVRFISPWFVCRSPWPHRNYFFLFNNDPRNRYKICCKCRLELCAPTFCRQDMMWTRFISMELSTAVIVIINFAGHAALLSQSLSLLRRTPSSLLRNFALCKARSHLSSSELEPRSIHRSRGEIKSLNSSGRVAWQPYEALDLRP